MRSDRLLTILMLLQSRGRVPAAELAGRLEVSVRTIYRDVDALSAAGVPVYTERGRHGGIELLTGYRTDMTGLTRDEARALFVLTNQSAHADLGLQTALRSALAKVMTALPEPFRPAATATSQRILVDPAGWLRAADPPGQLAVLQSAVFAGHRLKVRYRHTGQPTARGYTLDPYGLVSKGGTWYLVADHRGRPRLLRVSRVESAAALPVPARHRDGADLTTEWAQLRRQVEEHPAPLRVVARVRAGILDMFCRVHAPHLDGAPLPADPATPGWREVRLRFRGVAATRPLLAFGADIQILSPPEVRADLIRIATAAIATHSTPAAATDPSATDPSATEAVAVPGGPAS